MKRKINNGIFYVVISFVAVLGIASIVAAYSGYGTPKVVVEGNYIEAGQSVTTPVVPVVPDENLGAVSGPDSSSPYNSFNGITKWFSAQRMNKATTTLCVFSPISHGSASTTLDRLSINITTGTSTAATIVFATSTTAFASSTTASLIMTGQTVASGVKATLRWLPAVGVGLTGSIQGSLIRPDDYILVQTEASGLSGYTYSGTCNAEFTQF